MKPDACILLYRKDLDQIDSDNQFIGVSEGGSLII